MTTATPEVVPTTDTVIDQALSAIRARQVEVTADRDRIADDLRAKDVELRQLAIAERALDTNAPAKPAKATSVDAVRAVLTARGKATMSEIAVAIGKEKNTAKHGLQKLERDGEIRRTGKVINRSPEFEVVAQAA